MELPFHMMMFKTYHAQRNKIRQNMSAYGLSPGQPKVLRYLHSHEDCMLKDIAYNCDVEPATVSKILNNLEENGMLTREIVKDNKRALSLRITKKGEKALDLWSKHCDEVEEKSLEGFSTEEKEQFKLFLSRMYQNLTDRTFE
ncbi:MarR family winged helix-turn-helix transcriptional regulator [Amedibacillus sp. YH-ame6]